MLKPMPTFRPFATQTPSTNSVKILASDREQKVVLPEGHDIAPPRLGAVEEFELTIVQRSNLNPKQNLRPADISKLFVEDSKAQEPVVIGDPVREEQDPNRMVLDQLLRNERAITNLRTPLWLIFILLLLLFFK